jgi:hypothetical protein
MPIGGLDMKGNIALLAVSVLTVTWAVLPAGTPAHAADPPPTADLRMVYEHPEVAKDNSGVTWHWVLTNHGAAGAETVVATHRVSAGQKVVGVSQPCAGQGNDVLCRFDSLKPGEKRTGWIKTAVAPAGGMLRVNAQVTWREGQSVLPGISDPSTVDAGLWGTHSWGASGTDVATEMPRSDSR